MSLTVVFLLFFYRFALDLFLTFIHCWGKIKCDQYQPMKHINRTMSFYETDNVCIVYIYWLFEQCEKFHQVYNKLLNTDIHQIGTNIFIPIHFFFRLLTFIGHNWCQLSVQVEYILDKYVHVKVLYFADIIYIYYKCFVYKRDIWSMDFFIIWFILRFFFKETKKNYINFSCGISERVTTFAPVFFFHSGFITLDFVCQVDINEHLLYFYV